MSTAALEFLLRTFAGWVNRRQLAMIDYLKAENLVLRQQLGGRKPRFTDDQRYRLAVKGRVLGHRVLNELAGRLPQPAVSGRSPRHGRPAGAYSWANGRRPISGTRRGATTKPLT
ncbi:MAG TPA: hypothetical protein VMK12_31180 [Anaeromyxobacteraceae bacterium]|nr:hypothetical protein [Anaeromyxobacteraceae bacterium]